MLEIVHDWKVKLSPKISSWKRAEEAGFTMLSDHPAWILISQWQMITPESGGWNLHLLPQKIKFNGDEQLDSVNSQDLSMPALQKPQIRLKWQEGWGKMCRESGCHESTTDRLERPVLFAFSELQPQPRDLWRYIQTCLALQAVWNFYPDFFISSSSKTVQAISLTLWTLLIWGSYTSCSQTTLNEYCSLFDFVEVGKLHTDNPCRPSKADKSGKRLVSAYVLSSCGPVSLLGSITAVHLISWTVLLSHFSSLILSC